MSVRIIAEIGCNHNGDVQLAEQLILQAGKAGADAVKFQTFSAAALVSGYAKKAEYQQKCGDSDSQLEMLQQLELSQDAYRNLKEYAERNNIQIFSTAFDLGSIEFLHELGQNIWKIPSGEITNVPYLEKIADLQCKRKEIILSTGMSTQDEIQRAAQILQRSPDTRFTMLHCNTQYPTLDEDMNLRAMEALRESYSTWEIGLSDHSAGILAPVVAVGLGAVFIEKHITLDRNMPGPDHQASITVEELAELCKNIRRAERMMGKQKKIVTPSEQKNIFAARKSIVALCDIRKGEVFTEKNIGCKRPGNGISPVYWHEVLGRTAEQDFLQDEQICCTGYRWEEDNE